MECEVCENDVPSLVHFDGVDRCFKCDASKNDNKNNQQANREEQLHKSTIHSDGSPVDR